MRWNWQQPDWPEFTWNKSRLTQAEQEFLVGAGTLMGAVKHLNREESSQITIESIGTEAVTTAEIEGETLDRASVQSSLRRQFGLSTDNRRVGPAEQGMAEMMVDLYRSFAVPLSPETLFAWHRMLVRGRRDLKDVGRYRTSGDPMQVVSGPMHAPKVHFEAPPSSHVESEMDSFIAWFNRTGPGNADPLPALTRAGVAHLYFECIHPFEDGNGRIGRALAEKSLAQSIGQPTLTALAATILAKRKGYYATLQAVNKQNEITDWLAWFAGVAIEAQRRTTALVGFVIDKVRLLDRLRGQLNRRQEKALLRMLREGPEGFVGGLSAGKYATITGASPATATRDLVELVTKGALIRTGERKHTRYQLHIPPRSVIRVVVNERGDVVQG
jgi:Fic family protein